MKNWLKIIPVTGILFVSQVMIAQQVTTATPFLTIAPDARGGGMGEVGAATSADVYSLYYNPAKYAFAEGKAAVGFSYSPWMQNLQSGLNLYSLNAYYALGDRQVLAIGARFFTNGTFDFTDMDGKLIKSEKTSDMAINLAYAYKFNKYFSAALSLGYVSSGVGEVSIDDQDIKSAGAFVAGVSVLYNRNFKIGDNDARWGLGLNIADLGTKISYMSEGEKAFMPATLRFGGSLGMDVCKGHNLALGVDLNKLLVEAPDEDSQNKSVFGSAFSSFGNGEKLAWKLGLEYNWKRMVFVRTGYNIQDAADIKVFTLGLGGQYKGFALDAAYWLPNGSDSPLKNSFKLSLAYNF